MLIGRKQILAIGNPVPTGRLATARQVVLFGVILLGASLILVLMAQEWSFGLTVQALEGAIRSWGAWGVFASIGLMIIHSFVPFPAEFLAIANGMVYGLVWGTVITWIGAMLGAFLAFGLARKFGRPFVERMVTRKDWHIWDNRMAAQGGHLVLISRFIPIIAFNLINYAAGLMRVSWWTFGWATGIGILPMTILMVVVGDHIESLTWLTWGLLLAGGLMLWLVLRWKFRPLLEGENQTLAEKR